MAAVCLTYFVLRTSDRLCSGLSPPVVVDAYRGTRDLVLSSRIAAIAVYDLRDPLSCLLPPPGLQLQLAHLSAPKADLSTT
ncbi:hypothetical protein IW262DRAFT_1416152 [Armillaria fumosa]|nr:hypothetical protein IW262DRAFT_1416152 [Armillaria fumosa]